MPAVRTADVLWPQGHLDQYGVSGMVDARHARAAAGDDGPRARCRGCAHGGQFRRPGEPLTGILFGDTNIKRSAPRRRANPDRLVVGSL